MASCDLLFAPVENTTTRPTTSSTTTTTTTTTTSSSIGGGMVNPPIDVPTFPQYVKSVAGLNEQIVVTIDDTFDIISTLLYHKTTMIAII